MPRFSDIFVYDTATKMDGERMMFNGCRLIKMVGKLSPEYAVDAIMFDFQGMYLLFQHEATISGPYLLTTIVS
jgi:hypothetical protein